MAGAGSPRTAGRRMAVSPQTVAALGDSLRPGRRWCPSARRRSRAQGSSTTLACLPPTPVQDPAAIPPS